MNDWSEVRAVVNRAFGSHFHSVLGSVDEKGVPHLTPVGSLMLGAPGEALFFPIFTSGLRRRLAADPKVGILSVDGRASTWISALASGRFRQPIGVRMHAVAKGAPRPVTKEELLRWHRRVGWLRWFPAYPKLWGKIEEVQELKIYRVEPIRLGALTKGVELSWCTPVAPSPTATSAE